MTCAAAWVILFFCPAGPADQLKRASGWWWRMEGMGTLEQALQELHEAGKPVEISWLWDGGVDVKAGGEKRNFRSVPEVQRWLQHWYGLKPRDASPDALETELQKIYDSEINITIRIGGRDIRVALGNDFIGFDAKGKVSRMSDVLPWLQRWRSTKATRASKYQGAANRNITTIPRTLPAPEAAAPAGIRRAQYMRRLLRLLRDLFDLPLSSAEAWRKLLGLR
jgi:hypothetical protein